MGLDISKFKDDKGHAADFIANVVGKSDVGIGVEGISTSGTGVKGDSTSGAGVVGTSTMAQGIWGESQQGEGVHGISHSIAAGVAGYNDNEGAGVFGESQNFDGVVGESHSNQHAGVTGRNTAGGMAGFFDGDVVVTGVAVFAVAAALGAEAGAALVFATVDGVEAGALSDLLIDSRPINQEEIAKATEVFGNTIPYDKVILTNLVGLGGHSFTAPGVDGKIYCNIGKAFINPLGSYNNAYSLAGQMLIHELTHAWQIAYAGFLPGLMCSAIVTYADFTFGDNVYQYGPAGPPWWSFNPEQQGAIVDQ